jgi:hypothetical protein
VCLCLHVHACVCVSVSVYVCVYVHLPLFVCVCVVGAHSGCLLELCVCDDATQLVGRQPPMVDRLATAYRVRTLTTPPPYTQSETYIQTDIPEACTQINKHKRTPQWFLE